MFVAQAIAVLLAAQQPVGVHQATTGLCSPTVANVKGDVSINCIGVAPKALEKLNVELDRLHIDIAAKVAQANAWTQRYQELERALREHIADRELAGKAEEYLHQGDLEMAGTILDQVLAKDAADERSLAAAHYSLAGVLELQFQPLKALPHLRKAYEYYPDDLTYGEAYAWALDGENRFIEAGLVLQKILPHAEDAAKQDRKRLPDLASLQSLSASLYTQFRNYKEAAAPFKEALGIQRELAKTDPRRERELALTLDSAATFYMGTQHSTEAEQALLEELRIAGRLATQPAGSPEGVAHARYRLGTFYNHEGKARQAEDAFNEAVKEYRTLAAGKQATFRGGLAQALCSEGAFYAAGRRFRDAEPLLEECVPILDELSKTDADAYLPTEARGLADLGAVLGYLKKYMPAAQFFDAAFRIYQKFDDEKTTVWAPDIAALQEKNGDLFKDFGAPDTAEGYYREALKMYRRLAQAHPQAFVPALARTLDNLAYVRMKQDSLEEARTGVEEALALRRGLWQRDPRKYSDDVAASLLTKAAILVEQKAPCDQVSVLVNEALKLSPLESKEGAQDITEDCADR
jgi:hypothetical protein